jgi:hypothetical protein
MLQVLLVREDDDRRVFREFLNSAGHPDRIGGNAKSPNPPHGYRLPLGVARYRSGCRHEHARERADFCLLNRHPSSTVPSRTLTIAKRASPRTHCGRQNPLPPKNNARPLKQIQSMTTIVTVLYIKSSKVRARHPHDMLTVTSFSQTSSRITPSTPGARVVSVP